MQNFQNPCMEFSYGITKLLASWGKKDHETILSNLFGRDFPLFYKRYWRGFMVQML